MAVNSCGLRHARGGCAVSSGGGTAQPAAGGNQGNEHHESSASRPANQPGALRRPGTLPVHNCKRTVPTHRARTETACVLSKRVCPVHFSANECRSSCVSWRSRRSRATLPDRSSRSWKMKDLAARSSLRKARPLLEMSHSGDAGADRPATHQLLYGARLKRSGLSLAARPHNIPDGEARASQKEGESNGFNGPLLRLSINYTATCRLLVRYSFC